MDTSVSLGHAVHVNGLKSTLKTGDVLGAKFEWDFGDADRAVQQADRLQRRPRVRQGGHVHGHAEGDQLRRQVGIGRPRR